MLIDEIRPVILQHAKHLSPITTEAQAYLESGYRPGQAMSKLASPPNHNLFGVKANDTQFSEANKGKTWNWFWTKEWDGTKWIDVQDKFRVYPSYEASIKDHDNFFVSTLSRVERYQKTREATSLEQEIVELGKSGYATDPEYANKIRNMIETYKLDEKYDVSKIAKFNQEKKGSTKMPKVLLIAGHGLNKNNGYFDPGAQGYVPKGEHRWFTEDVFPAMKKYLPANADVVFHTAYNVYSHNNIVALAKSLGNDTIVIECHFDSGGVAYSKAGGHVIIYSGYGPDALDLRLRDAIKATVGLHPNYANGISKRNNLRNVNNAASGGINYRLVEWGMSSHKKNSTYMLNNVDTIAKAFVKAIFEETNTNAPVPETGSSSNPQGLKTVDLKPYKAPRLPYDKLGEGTIIEIDENFHWLDTKEKELMISGKYKDIVGTKDEIIDTMDISSWENRNHSNVAYLLKNYRSWIPEEYVVEAKASWTLVDEEVEEPSDDVATYDGDYVQLHGKRYKIGDEIK